MDEPRTAEGTGEEGEGIEVELGDEATLEGDGTGEALPEAEQDENGEPLSEEARKAVEELLSDDAAAAAQMARMMAEVPQAPWTVDLHNSVTHYAPLPNGGKLVQVTPVIVGPGGQLVTLAPGVRIWFSKNGWENFQKEVEADGVKSKIQRATVLPPGAKI